MKKIYLLMVLLLLVLTGCGNKIEYYDNLIDSFSVSMNEYAETNEYSVLAEKITEDKYNIKYVLYNKKKITKKNASRNVDNIITTINAKINEDGSIKNIEMDTASLYLQNTFDIIQIIFNNSLFKDVNTNELKMFLKIESIEDWKEIITKKEEENHSITKGNIVTSINFIYNDSGDSIRFVVES